MTKIFVKKVNKNDENFRQKVTKNGERAAKGETHCVTALALFCNFFDTVCPKSYETNAKNDDF